LWTRTIVVRRIWFRGSCFCCTGRYASSIEQSAIHCRRFQTCHIGECVQSLSCFRYVHFFKSSFQVCDEPHPLLVRDMFDHCLAGQLTKARKVVQHLYKLGYAPSDIISMIMRIAKTHQMPEHLQLEYIKVRECFHLFQLYSLRRYCYRRLALHICASSKVYRVNYNCAH
jgi:hypothetical protein